MPLSPPPLKEPPRKPSKKTPAGSASAFLQGSSPRAQPTAPSGFHGRPGTESFRAARSSFPPAGCAPHSLTPTTPSTLKYSSKPTRPRESLLSSLARESPTPPRISGEQFISPLEPCSPPKYWAHELKLSTGTARRVLASMLGYPIARATFYRWLAQGLIPADKLVGHYRVKSSVLQKFAQEAAW